MSSSTEFNVWLQVSMSIRIQRYLMRRSSEYHEWVIRCRECIRKGIVGLHVVACLNNPCLNDGNCTIGADRVVRCTCPTRFTGARCETVIGNRTKWKSLLSSTTDWIFVNRERINSVLYTAFVLAVDTCVWRTFSIRIARLTLANRRFLDIRRMWAFVS